MANGRKIEESRHHLLPKEFAGMRVALTGLGVIEVTQEKVGCENNVMRLDRRIHALTHYWWVIMLTDERLVKKQRMGMGGLTGRMTFGELEWFERAMVGLEKRPNRLDPFWGRWKLDELLV